MPIGLQTVVLSTGFDSREGRGLDDDRYDRIVCDEQVQSLIDAYRCRSMLLREFAIIQNAKEQSFAIYDDEPPEPDVKPSFNFHDVAIQCRQCEIHFDYVVKVRTLEGRKINLANN